jgi:hypothetical protein
MFALFFFFQGYLVEIRICLRYDYTLINCTKCGNDTAIAYFPGLEELTTKRRKREVDDFVPPFYDETVCIVNIASKGVRADGKLSGLMMIVESVCLGILILHFYLQ